jgi:hypothetical protein
MTDIQTGKVWGAPRRIRIVCNVCGAELDPMATLAHVCDTDSVAMRAELVALRTELAELKARRREIPDDDILVYAADNGAMEVHRSWRDMMLKQGRYVAPERMQWETLDGRDMQLDAQIAAELVADFLTWHAAWQARDSKETSE